MEVVTDRQRLLPHISFILQLSTKQGKAGAKTRELAKRLAKISLVLGRPDRQGCECSISAQGEDFKGVGCPSKLLGRVK